MRKVFFGENKKNLFLFDCRKDLCEKKFAPEEKKRVLEKK